MAKPSESIMAFKEKYGIDSDELWPVPGGKSYAIMHKALQRVARQQGIIITVNVVEALCNIEAGFAVVKAFGKLGDAFCESYGEASPKNNRNQYPLAMAQKRAEDRVILGLLSVYGDVYGEDEAEDFKQPRQNPHVNRAEDFDIAPSDDFDASAKRMKVKDARPQYKAWEAEMKRIDNIPDLKEWWEAMKEELSKLPGEWPLFFKDAYKKHGLSIMNGNSITSGAAA